MSGFGQFWFILMSSPNLTLDLSVKGWWS